MTEIKRIFKTDDLNSVDQLHKFKKDAIQDLEKRFTRNLNSISRVCNDDDDFWKDRRFYMLPVRLQASHSNYALENKKAFIKWFLTKFPNYNAPYNPKKRNT